MTIDMASVVSFLRNLGSLAAIGFGLDTAYTSAGATGKISTGVVLTLLGSVVQWIEHHNTTKPTTPPVVVTAPPPPPA